MRSPGGLAREPPGSAAEVAAVAGAQPEPNEVPVPRGVVVVHVVRAAMDDDPIVEELDLAALEPEVEAVGGILEEGIHVRHRLERHGAGRAQASSAMSRRRPFVTLSAKQGGL